MPPKASKVKGKQKPQDEQREETLQAVILADSYELRFAPFTLETPRCLLPLANTPLIEYTLEFLAIAGVQDIFVYCGSHVDQVDEYIKASKWKLSPSPFKQLLLLKSDAASVGDALRDLDNRGLITGDFLLVNGDLVSNVSIESALGRHRARREKDKNAIMTVILREAGIHHRTKSINRRPVFVFDPTIDRCLHYEERHVSGRGDRYISLDPDILSSHGEIEIREDLIDCQIDICTPDVLGLWSDNFDYQSVRTSFLFGVLKDYELHGKTIHMHILADQYAARVKSLRAYDAVSKDMMGRWIYPLCPDSNHVPGQNYQYTSYKTYQESAVRLSRTCKVGAGCVMGRDTVIGDGSTIDGSTLGRGCKIGQNVHIEDSYLWDNVVVGEGSTITKAVIAAGAVVGKGSIVEAGTLLSYKVRVADNITINGSQKITCAQLGDSSNNKRTDTSIVGDGGEGYDYAADSDTDSDASDFSTQLYRIPRASESDSSISTLESNDLESEEAEDRSRRPSVLSETSDDSVPNKDFHLEATASILDGLQKEDLPENIFLELNAFRMTLDASQHEVRRAVVAAFIKRITSLGSSEIGAREAVNRVISKYRSVIERIIFDKESNDKLDQVDFLLCVQRELIHREKGETYLLFVAKEVYDLELIEEDGILQWWADTRSTEGGMTKVRGLTQQFVTFLEEAEEDESEEDEDED